jgi:hypothetical protein
VASLASKGNPSFIAPQSRLWRKLLIRHSRDANREQSEVADARPDAAHQTAAADREP